MTHMKICAHCGLNKDESQFYRNARWLTAWCRDCFKERSRHQAVSGYFKEKRRRQAIASGIKPRRALDLIAWAALSAFTEARRRSLRNGRDFNLTRDWVEDQFREFTDRNYHTLATRTPFRPSLDRIDSKAGYVVGNVRVVWLIENLARNQFTDDQVIEFCKRKLGLYAE